MEKYGKRILSLLCAAVMLLSFVAIPDFGAQKAEAAGAADELDAMETAGHVYANYTAANFDAGTGTVVADDEAYTKNAISSTVKDLTGAGKFMLYRYCANADADKQYYKIAELSADALMLNQGYQIYKFSVDVPATGMGTGGVTYFFDDNWEMVHNSMGTVISSFAGKKVDLFLSMKITGEATAATVYIDRLAVVDPCDNYVDEDGVCTKCGKVIMNKAEIELNEKNAAGHVYANYVPSTFDGNETFVTDPDAYSAQSAIQAGPFNLSVNGFGFYAYSGSNGDLKLDAIAPEELLINQGYQIYKLSAKITDSLADSACTYYRSDAGAWKFVNFNGGTVVKAFVGKQLDIYISLKIEGSLENATCYVDRLAFVDPCENYAGEDGKCTKCGKELPLPASHELFDYNANNFTGTSETDAEAYKGIAKSYSGKDLTGGAAVKIHRYDTGASDVSIQYMKLGELAAANIKNNQGYQTYEFTTTIPAEGMTDSSPFVYFLDDWSFQNAQMAKDLKTLAGKTVTISLSMKVVGELSSATVYIDRVQILSVCEDYLNEDGTQCRVCGKSMLDESLPEELQRLDENHLFRYNTSNFAVNADNGESIVADVGSPLGSAFYCANLNIGTKIEMLRYDNAAAAAQQYVVIGAIAAADVKLNQGYQFYKFTVEIPAEGMANGNFVYVDYAGWKCLNATMAHDMKTLEGKTVDVYLSLKANGDDTSNTECYIDQVIMVDRCENYANGNGICSVCGAQVEIEAVDTTIATFTPSNFSLPYSDPIVNGAVQFSYTDRYAKGDEGLYNAMIRSDEQVLGMYTNAMAPVGEITVAQLKAASAAGGYITYKFSNADLTGASFVYMFDCWGFQCPLTSYADALNGKLVDVYVTMKVTGNVSSTGEDSPVYSISKVVIKGAENITCEHNYSSLVCIDNDNHGYICYNCGEILTEAHTLGEGTVTKEPTENEEGKKEYTCSVCNGVIIEVLAKLPTPAQSWNLTLDGNIQMNFVLNLTAEEIESATVIVTVNGQPEIKNTADLVNEEGKAVLSVELAAAQMTESVTIALNVDGQQIVKDYTVREYADYILDDANGYDEATKALVKNMLNYGAASQIYFDYNTDKLANQDVEIADAAVPTEGGSMDITGGIAGVTFYGASLVHENKIAVRFYFIAESLEGISFGEYEAVQKGDKYCVEIANINPQDMDVDITIEASNGIDSLKVSYSPLDYIIRMYNKGSASAELVQALYGYYLAAEAYTAA